jgi:serine protease Do
VRAGAQGIGFAIPVDNALEVAARLLDVEKLENKRHGILPLADHRSRGPVKVARVERDSPAASSGLRQGDELLRIGSTEIARGLDVERAMLGRNVGESVPVEISRDGRTMELEIVVAAKPGRTRDIQPVGSFQQATWEAFGMILEPESASTLKSRGLPLEGGMRVVAVRPGSAAAEQMVAKGDILVQIHRWYTTSAQDVQYILNRSDSIAKMGPVRFDIVRGKERFYGQMALKAEGETVRR